MNEKRELCEKIGAAFGLFYIKDDMLCLEVDQKIYQYTDYADMLFAWVAALVEQQASGKRNWEKEIISIYSFSDKKHPIGVRQEPRRTKWRAYIDLCNHEHPHGKNVALGSYESIVDAVCARRDYLSDIKDVDLNTEEGYCFALEKAKEVCAETKRKNLLRKNRKIKEKTENA
jgi:hypothetical protein